MKIGDKVKRGPDWQYYFQDCDSKGKQTTGIVTAFDTPPWFYVKWETGNTQGYRFGYDYSKRIKVFLKEIILLGYEQEEMEI